MLFSSQALCWNFLLLHPDRLHWASARCLPSSSLGTYALLAAWQTAESASRSACTSKLHQRQFQSQSSAWMAARSSALDPVPARLEMWPVHRVGSAVTRRLQNGRFDSPDRLFSGVREAWESVTGGAADFKELIPEFFLPGGGAFLVNRRKLALGTRQDGCA